MGMYADVALAINAYGWAKLPKETQEFVLDLFNGAVDTSECGEKLFHISDVKWYPISDKEVANLYLTLFDEANEDNYKLVVAYHDFPDNDSADSGCWDDNPWSVHKFTTVGISYT